MQRKKHSAGNAVLMDTINHINRRFHKAITVAATGLDQRRQVSLNHKSGRYTTDWHALFKAKCC